MHFSFKAANESEEGPEAGATEAGIGSSDDIFSEILIDFAIIPCFTLGNADLFAKFANLRGSRNALRHRADRS